MGLIRVDLEKCERDGICVDVCPLGILDMDQERGPVVRAGMSQFCIACGHCVAACPYGALDNARNPLAKHDPLDNYPVIDPQKALQFLRSRRSVRRYRSDPVPRDVLRNLLNAARYAPSGHNSQGISYLAVGDKKDIKRICEIVLGWMAEVIKTDPELARRLHMPGIIKASKYGIDLILRDAPLVVFATASRDNRSGQVTTYLALEYVELYATTLGLGTCWAGYTQTCAQQFPPLPQFLRIPSDRIITGAMMIGYPKYTYFRLPERDPLDVEWFEG